MYANYKGKWYQAHNNCVGKENVALVSNQNLEGFSKAKPNSEKFSMIVLKSDVSEMYDIGFHAVIDSNNLKVGKMLMNNREIIVYSQNYSFASMYSFKSIDRGEYTVTIPVTLPSKYICRKRDHLKDTTEEKELNPDEFINTYIQEVRSRE